MEEISQEWSKLTSRRSRSSLAVKVDRDFLYKYEWSYSDFTYEHKPKKIFGIKNRK